MRYIATFCKATYRGMYGSKGDDGWDRRYTWEHLVANSDEDAVEKARAKEGHGYSLGRVFAIDHEIALTQRAATA